MDATVQAALIGAGSSLAGVVVTLSAEAVINVVSKRKDNKLKSLRELQGMRVKVHQDVISRTEAVIHSAYHQAMISYYFSHPKEKEAIPDLNLNQGQRWSLKAEKWVENVTDDLAELNKILSDISMLFPEDPQIQKAIDEFLTGSKSLNVGDIKANPTIDEINEWDQKSLTDLQKIADEVYNQPLVKIIDLVRGKIKTSHKVLWHHRGYRRS